MKILIGICFVVVLAWLSITTSLPRAPVAQPCTQEWFSYLDNHYFDISDSDGHGPDMGNSEWFDAFEEKAKLPVTNRLPKQQRCQLIQDQLARRSYIINEQLGWAISL
ncbi:MULTISPECIES: hypothetical protein [unclassified Caballeronia]|uniref:hypothetical protein n=1 Tax=unclassified Caballeronia TaxID=2646786 RepID=UPI001FD0BB7F|nr:MULTISPECIES: hypothetical protein [unclassified Caballeronia]